MIDYTKTMHTENVELQARVRELEDKLRIATGENIDLRRAKKERTALKSFARDVIQAMWDGGVDGCDVQNLAEKHKLIESTFATEADAEIHDHVSPGDPFFRFADWLKDAAPDPLAGAMVREAINEINKPRAERRCVLCQHYDPLNRPGKGFCTVNKEHWPTVVATHCCEKFAPNGGEG